jgi:ribose transport system permease protein
VIGRHVYAVGGNITAARLSGVNVDRTLVTVYSISGLMAGLAGLLLAGRTNSGYPTAAVGAELDAISAVIIGGASFFGGVGTVWGTAIGVVFITVLRNGLVLLQVPIEWQTVAIGVVIIMAVYVDVLRQRGGQRS